MVSDASTTTSTLQTASSSTPAFDSSNGIPVTPEAVGFPRPSVYGDIGARSMPARAPKIIKDWQVVLADRQSGSRSNPAKLLILRAKTSYKKMSKEYVNDDKGRFKASMNKYFEELGKEYPDRNRNEPPFLILCSAKVKDSNRAEDVHTHTYEAGVSPKYGIAMYPDAVEFYLKSRDTPSPGDNLLRWRLEVDKVSPQVDSSTKKMLMLYTQQLEQCEVALEEWKRAKPKSKERPFTELVFKRSYATLKVLRKELKPLLDGKEKGKCNPESQVRRRDDDDDGDDDDDDDTGPDRDNRNCHGEKRTGYAGPGSGNATSHAPANQPNGNGNATDSRQTPLFLDERSSGSSYEEGNDGLSSDLDWYGSEVMEEEDDAFEHDFTHVNRSSNCDIPSSINLPDSRSHSSSSSATLSNRFEEDQAGQESDVSTASPVASKSNEDRANDRNKKGLVRDLAVNWRATQPSSNKSDCGIEDLPYDIGFKNQAREYVEFKDHGPQSQCHPTSSGLPLKP
jgi:hypothetical protein